ncbi:UDP-N-acetylglucosamine 2-epimerase [Herbaspirillum sp. NPDC101397]|uniref:UDP-N-acetylglucosamine 2-epimerase n=1 Tax=Herbaspirillum sp. NPDC101397 TaxID=3364006 RepID=UPI00383BD38F
MKRKICIVTGTRAEYGLLRWLMEEVSNEPNLTLQIVATGMHLSPEFGLTYKEIEKDGFRIDKKVELLMSSDTSVGIAKSMGLGLIGFADVFADLAPDLVLVLGDRFEIFSAVVAAMASRIPIAHLHGGEATEGLIDEAIRHSITKMSHLHFVAAEEYRRRVIQLGEDPVRVYNVGGLGLDGINRVQLMDRAALENSLGFSFAEKNLLVTFHPVTLESNTAWVQMQELLASLAELNETRIIFTLPNADTDGREMIGMIARFVEAHPNAVAFPSLGQLRYLSCLAQVDGVIGNSSSGLIEAPSFKKGTINIGSRQDGRLQAGSVINCEPVQSSITAALQHLYSAPFQLSLANVVNPYGESGASKKIVDVLKTISLDGILKKRFYDISHSCA